MFKRMLFAAWLATATLSPAFATSILPLDLTQIIDQSATAFQGTVVDSRSGRDPQTGLIVTMTTFRVDDVLKGDVGSTHTIKQIGGESASENVRFKVHGVPTFTVGESYVLFMNGVSPQGFSSPVGLSQGRFAIQQGDAGPEVGNGADFGDLTAGMGAEVSGTAKSKTAHGRAAHRLALDEFKQLVRTHTGAKR